jgi:hypothetical protein
MEWQWTRIAGRHEAEDPLETERVSAWKSACEAYNSSLSGNYANEWKSGNQRMKDYYAVLVAGYRWLLHTAHTYGLFRFRSVRMVCILREGSFKFI